MPERILYWILPALLLSAIMPYLLDLGYQVADAEVLTISVGVAAFGLVLASLLQRQPKATSVVLGFFVYWIIDAYFIHAERQLWLAFGGGFAALWLLNTRFRETLLAILLTFLVFWIGSNLALQHKVLIDPPLTPMPGPSEGGRVDRPPLIHIILDEQMSPDALPNMLPPGNHPARRIVDDYVARGFEVWTDVRSNHHLTYFVLSELFGADGNGPHVVRGHGAFTWSLKGNEYFERLRRRGYAVDAVQSNFLEICTASPGVRCFTYSRSGNGQAYKTRIEGWWPRIAMAVRELHSYLRRKQKQGGVIAYRTATALARRLGAPVNTTPHILQPAAMLDVLDAVGANAANLKPGQALFLHLLLPHRPYVLTPECALKPEPEWARQFVNHRTERTLEVLYASYWDQAACVHLRIMKLVDSLPVGTIVIVHGDHGARITQDAKGIENDADMLQTFFAAKQRGIVPSRRRERSMLNDLFQSNTGKAASE